MKWKNSVLPKTAGSEMKILLLLFFLSSCAQVGVEINGSPADYVQVVKRGKYSELKGIQDVLRNVSGATLMITFRQTGTKEATQALIGISIGGEGKKSPLSRASLRLENGHLVGLARALDDGPGQVIRSREMVIGEGVHVAALVVDYEKDEMQLYLDGKPLESEGSVAFRATKTSDTPSLSAALGAEDDGSAFFFEGELKDPMVWSRKLGPDVIKLYQAK
jgi:Concanavalin A-like lectin/glucanases superfamily